MTDRTLWHLTLDTMSVARTARSEVSDRTVEHLAGVLARARKTGRPVKMIDDVPNPHAVRLLREGEGNAAFSILTGETGGEALVTCSAFWSFDGAAAALAFAATVNAARLIGLTPVSWTVGRFSKSPSGSHHGLSDS